MDAETLALAKKRSNNPVPASTQLMGRVSCWGGGSRRARVVRPPLRPARPARGALALGRRRADRHLDRPARPRLLLARGRQPRFPGSSSPRASGFAAALGALGAARCSPLLVALLARAARATDGAGGRAGPGRDARARGDPRQRRLRVVGGARHAAVRQPAAHRRRTTWRWPASVSAWRSAARRARGALAGARLRLGAAQAQAAARGSSRPLLGLVALATRRALTAVGALLVAALSSSRLRPPGSGRPGCAPGRSRPLRSAR